MNAELVPLIGAVLVASVLGSLHCAGMCGAFVAMAVGLEDDSAPSRLKLQVAYNSGRLVVYMLIGAVFGFAGRAIDFGGEAVGLHRAAVLLAAGTMIVMGTLSLLRIAGVRIPRPPAPGFMSSAFIRAHRLASAFSPVRRALIIGLMTGLLPCGWLYAFALVAAGTASPIAGAITMGVFWIGTLPILIAIGTGVQALSGALRRAVPVMMAVVIVTMGVLTAIGRVGMPMPSPDHAVQVVPSLDMPDRQAVRDESGH
ncbi:MAG TPA: sulfite exporter TauE/SafE family protein [Phycisphaerales bacterium]|nr:sulfite exporter TauE/SafE family protein [Phycisphaerales bacterium]